MVILDIHRYTRILAIVLCCVTGLSALVSVWPVLQGGTMVENSYPISEENTENSSKENLNTETEDEIFETYSAFNANSRAYALIRMAVTLRSSQFYQKIPSPPPDLI